MNLIKYFFSTSFTGVLLLVFGITIGAATFIENDFGAIGAQSIVYRTTWFEVLLGIMTLNMIGVIITKKMWRREKWVNLLFHTAFIVILIGAAITRFFGEEGMMHIREGSSANSFVSEGTYIQGVILEGDEKKEFSEKVLFSVIKKNKFHKSIPLQNGELDIRLKHYIFNAKQVAEPDPENGVPILTVVTAGNGGREESFVRSGEYINVNGLPIGLNTPADKNAISFMETDSGLVMISPITINTMSMDTREQGVIEANTAVKAPFRHLLTVNGMNFVLKSYQPSATLRIVSSPAEPKTRTIDAVVLEVSTGNDAKDVVLTGSRGMIGKPAFLQVGNVNLQLSYGSKEVKVPFVVELKDFQLERYPGSNSPSSYASEVVVHDNEKSFPYRIYMNHVLDYRGYRFFQSSYDTDELGTVLSVNKDKPGTLVSYFGYLLLAFGLIAIVFSKRTRFHQLSGLIDRIHKKREKLAGVMVFLLFFAGGAARAQTYPEAPTKEQARAFGELIYQSSQGRMAPVHSLASDLLRKIYKTNKLGDYDADQVLLSMMSRPHEWHQVKMIKVGDKRLREILKIDGKYACFNDFFDVNGRYVLRDLVNAAYAKKPANQSTLDKEVIKVDERVNIAYMVYQGRLLRIFPVPNDPGHHWVSPVDDELYGLRGDDSLFVRKGLQQYLQSLTNGNNDLADEILKGIKKYQALYGSAVMPSPAKVKMEIMFNSWNIFEKLFPFYLLAGIILLIIQFVRVLKPRLKLKWPIRIIVGVIIAGFVVYTAGLAMRWYISGHAPWSNGYEAMIYIGWANMLAGLIFGRKSAMTLAVTSILTGIILFVAHLSFLDPQITNLVPVLKSYWLTIHVATITASYGFFALGALLAFVNLVTMIFKTKENNVRLSLSIKELTYVLEMALIVGIILLTIGNFLGGVWANESWGRYWGWDPKETWALASIIFYAFVLHMRLIPGFKSTYAFNLAALLAFASIIMTFFGVNYYLSGLHSYAAGDPVPIPSFVYYTIAVVAIVSITAYWRHNRLEKVNDAE